MEMATCGVSEGEDIQYTGSCETCDTLGTVVACTNGKRMKRSTFAAFVLGGVTAQVNSIPTLSSSNERAKSLPWLNFSLSSETRVA